MTGHGRGVAEHRGCRVTIELRSVNHRFLDLKLRGASSAAVEELVAARIRERLGRGAIGGTVRVEAVGTGGAVRVDRALAIALHRELVELAAELGLAPPTLRDVIGYPGIVSLEDSGGAEDAIAAAAIGAIDAALEQLIAMRVAEGAALARELRERIASVAATLSAIAAAAAGSTAAVRDRLMERVRRLVDAEAVDPTRMAQEIAILVERADITEEIVRIRSHLAQLDACLDAREPVGRRLDFLIQELGREINTIGSKSANQEIAQAVVTAKVELEKIREQVQNVE